MHLLTQAWSLTMVRAHNRNCPPQFSHKVLSASHRVASTKMDGVIVNSEHHWKTLLDTGMHMASNEQTLVLERLAHTEGKSTSRSFEGHGLL